MPALWEQVVMLIAAGGVTAIIYRLGYNAGRCYEIKQHQRDVAERLERLERLVQPPELEALRRLRAEVWCAGAQDRREG